MSPPLLRCRGLEAGYGVSQVLFGLDFDIQPGEVIALLGRNGMGKSTTIKTIVGGLRPQRGEILFDGRPIHAARADHIARLGVAIVPEGRQCFPNLSVREHLLAFADRRNGVAEPWTLSRLYALFPRLAERAGHMGNQLSGGEQQMLAIARALSTNPRLLILDEATEGLAQKTTVASEVRDECFAVNDVGEVAAPHTRDAQFAPGLVHFFEQQHAGTSQRCLAGSHQTGGSAADHNHIKGLVRFQHHF